MFQEKNLIKKAKNGDQKAQAELYQKNIEPLYKYVRHKVDIKERAEDICAEAFVKAFERISDFKEKSSFKTWVYTIARNLVIDWYRVKDRTVGELDYEVEAPEPTKQDNSKNEAEVKLILSKLKSNYAEVLELRFLMGFSIKETAAAINTSEGNIKVLQNRAIKRARELAEEINS